MKALLVILAFVGFMAVISGQVKSRSTLSGRPSATSSGGNTIPGGSGASLQPIATAGLTSEAKRQIVAELKRLEPTLPQRGQQMGVSTCGQPVFCTGDPRAEVRAEIDRIEREIAAGR